MKRILLGGLVLLASAASFAQTHTDVAHAPVQHHSGKHHKKHHGKHAQPRAAHHDGSVADRAVPLDSSPDFKP